MKILYAIQGTGNGHLSRARDVVPALQRHGTVDLLVSGTQADVRLPFPVRYQLKGWSFVFGKGGGVDLWRTYRQTQLVRLQREIRQLPLDEYDLILNDFEPVSAWACRLRGKSCVALSHQAAVLSTAAPRPRRPDPVGHAILRWYAPAAHAYGFHFARFADHIFPPVIRRQVRALQPTDAGHYTVYLPAYDDRRLVRALSRFAEVRWEVFSKHNKAPAEHRNVSLRPVDNDAFVASMASSRGVLCGAGFETPAEALFLRKKLLVVPMKNQYEQHCNAAALRHLGVPVMPNLQPDSHATMARWLADDTVVPTDFPDMTQEIIDQVVRRHAGQA